MKLCLTRYEYVVQNWLYSDSVIQNWILVSVDNVQLIFVSYDKPMHSSTVANNMVNITIPDQIGICGSKLILELFA